MKNAANCVNQCELQDTLIIDVSNAHGGPGSLPGPRPVEGRFLPKRRFAMASCLVSRMVPPPISDGGHLRERTLLVRGGWWVLSLSLHHGLLAVDPILLRMVVRLTGPVERVLEVPPTIYKPNSFSRPQLGRDDPLNLSILLRGGKENNDDSLSKGD